MDKNISMENSLVVSDGRALQRTDEVSPELIVQAGGNARYAWEEFLHGSISNQNTKRAYEYAVRRFMGWCQDRGIELVKITPKDVRTYLNKYEVSIPTRKLHLAGLRHFFDMCVTRHAILLNPALSVRGERYSVKEGKTPSIGIKNARLLLDSIDTDTIKGKRDKAIIGILVFTACRIGAVANLRVKDFYSDDMQYFLRLREKGNVSREIPVRHDLQEWIIEWMEHSGIVSDDPASPLFRSFKGKTYQLNPSGLPLKNIWDVIKKRLKDAGLSSRYSAHSFRVTTLTNLIEQGVAIEDVQHLAGHADPRTTQLYDRTRRKVTRNIVERISV